MSNILTLLSSNVDKPLIFLRSMQIATEYDVLLERALVYLIARSSVTEKNRMSSLFPAVIADCRCHLHAQHRSARAQEPD